ncbi:root phototropism protein 3 [Humulus lupulus]|uniref:root phototropism protein 3 n=1 Tax=Humulus lupulus TaxID=3486 RepID=UPI002B40B386|nr:root phototropism protein 3 [Humulus lupulus]
MNTNFGIFNEDSATLPGKQSPFAAECWFDDACILDMDYFVKTLSGIKAKGVRPDLIGSIITHYASKWLPDLVTNTGTGESMTDTTGFVTNGNSTESVTVSWMKKRFFVETLVGVLPPEKDAIPCNFLLRLLRTAKMVGVEPSYLAELERRISWQLDQASLKELMIPSFSHTCGTLLDVDLVYRLVKRFVSLDEVTKSNGAAAFVKVAKLVDSYLAEAAVDANLSMTEFVALADALPSHARAMDDGLYRAIDTYLKAHPSASKHERKSLCRLIDCRKLSPEASLHAAQNERLPVRAVIQVLFSEQSKYSRNNNVSDWSGSFSGTRSPNLGLEQPSRCLSKREISVQQMEIKRLKDDVLRLQSQCNSMQIQMERLLEKKKSSSSSSSGFFKWKKFGFVSSLKSSTTAVSIVTDLQKKNIDHHHHHDNDHDDLVGFDQRQTPTMNMKTKLVVRGRTPPKWRKSMS